MRRNHRPTGWSYSSDYGCHSLPSLRRAPPKRHAQSRKTRIMDKQNKYKNSKTGAPEHRRKGQGDGSILSLVLDAKQRRISEIEDQLFDTKLQYETIRRENKTLKSLQKKQEIELDKMKSQENDLPRLISHHVDEQRVLRTRLKRAKVAERDLEEKVRDNNNALQQMESSLVRLKTLVQNRDLGGRAKLAKQLSQKEKDLQNALIKINKLDRLIELSEGSFSRQLLNEKTKHRSTLDKLCQVEDDYENTKQKLKRKERELNDADVYSLRRKASNCTSHLQANKQAEVTSSCDVRRKNKNDSKTRVACLRNIVPSKSLPDNSKASDRLKNKRKAEKSSITEVANDVGGDCGEFDARNHSNILSSIIDTMHASLGDSTMTVSNPVEAGELNQKKEERIISMPCLDDQKTQPTSLCTDATTEANRIDIACHEPVSRDLVCSENLMEESKIKLEEVLEKVTTVIQNSSGELSDGDIINESEKKIKDTVDLESGLRMDSFSPRLQKKPYTFSKEVENLHRGIPSIIRRNQKRTMNCNDLHFGSYSPTICATPKRNNNSSRAIPHCKSGGGADHEVAQTEIKIPFDSYREDLKGTKESDILFKLFGKIETEKDRLLGQCALFTEENASGGEAEAEEVSESQGHGDSFNVRETNLFKSNELGIDRKSNREIS